MGALPEGGAMVALEASETEVLEDLPEGLSLAAVNSPTSLVLSGAQAPALELLERWKAKGRKATRLRVSHAFHSALMEPMLAEFEQVAASITYSPPQIPIVSNLTGEALSAEQATDPAYWVAQVRQPVRFGAGIEHLTEHGASAFLELGPDAALSPMAQACLAESETGATVAPLLRQGRPEGRSLLSALAAAHAGGATVAWGKLLAGQGAKRVSLPTYPFQRQRFWLEPRSGGGDAAAIGQGATGHPLLGAFTSIPEEEGLLLTGRLALGASAWLGAHAVLGTAILPGAALVEMALAAAGQVGAEMVEELTIEAPLALPERGAIQVAVRVGARDGEGRRPLAIHSRPEPAANPAAEWVRNASGGLAEVAPPASESLGEWPPPGAEPLALTGFYERVADLGLDYGPAFQGLRAAWRHGEELFAEVELAEEQASEAGRYGIHPALLDAALQPALLREEGAEELRVPFDWAGVRLLRSGPEALRVRLRTDGERLSLLAADGDGAIVAAVAELSTRPLDSAQLQVSAATATDSLFVVRWEELALPEGGEDEARPRRVDCVPAPGLDPPAAAAALCAEVLERLQEAIAEDGGERIAFVTRDGVAVRAGESADPAAAAVGGLVRSAQAEHPGRFVLVDSDGAAASESALAAALSLDEPQLSLREGVAARPRLERAPQPESEAIPLDPGGTVLLTGGTGTLGSLFARHLAATHGVRHLVLASRRGPAAPGAEELRAELAALGAAAEVIACDAGDRAQLAAAIGSIPAERPLTAVIHCAGVTDDGVIGSLDPERLKRTMAPKASAAWYLHELTKEIPGCELILFSSVAAGFQSPGQGNYAAANAFLEALARRRHAEGLPALSLSWGAWEEESEMTGRLGDADRARIGRGGVLPLSSEQGLRLFDHARALHEPQLVPVALDTAALRAAARAGLLPPLLAGLVRVPARPARRGSLAERLAGAAAGEREEIVTELVRTHVAAVLGHASAAAIDPEAPFKDLGFDSLAAVELRNRLAAATGLRLPATLVFDHPTATAVGAHLLSAAAGGRAVAPVRARAAAGAEEPIAIVGMSCRYPGGVHSPEDLWRLVAAGGDGISTFPEDRGWPLERLFDPDPDHPGTSYAREGGFLADAAEFDAEFFGISPREAVAMDPQQRLLLEAAWEAFEAAGIDPAALAGSDTGVFAGAMHHDYGQGATEAELEGYQGVGAAGSVVSGRVAYTLGLEGPAVTVDTACSSSLVAMHLAAQSLRSGECGLALAGGVTVMSTPAQFVEFSRQRGLARDGRCKPFAAAADGTGWSEGVGLLLLERLADAEANGHEVLATIRGSATNQDGASNGLTAPNGPSQERVIRQALANAGLEPAQVGAVEAHGTGTALGDPIEAGALLATYGQGRDAGAPLALGSIKSNLGHTQAAAGVAGVIKMALALRHGVLPRTLHVDEPTPHVDWSAGAVELLTEAREWEANGQPRRAGVSSFGISGTNAHLIVEEAPVAVAAAGDGEEDRPGPAAGEPVALLLSAKSEAALSEGARRLGAHLREHPQLPPAAVGRALLEGRAALEHRAAVVGADGEELTQALAALAAGDPHAALVRRRAGSGKLAFLFSGQGAQRPGMGAGLYRAFPVFAEAFDQTCAVLEEELVPSLREAIFAPAGSELARGLDRTDLTQASLFALQVALFRLVSSFGLVPDHLIGHSIGEISAAHVAGALSLPDAARLVALRGRLMAELEEGGAMAAVRAGEQEVAESLAGFGGRLCVAAVNAPDSVVVSGDREALEEWRAEAAAAGRETRGLRVSHAFHSHRIEPMLPEFEAALAELSFAPPRIPIVSNLSARELSPEQAASPAYWARHAREAVRFADGIAELDRAGVGRYLELGPDAVLSGLAAETLGPDSDALCASTLRAKREDVRSFLLGLGAVHADGGAVDWSPLFAGAGRAKLPTYPFQRRRYWLRGAGAGDAAALGQDASDHPLLGAKLSLAGAEDAWRFTGSVSVHAHPWLADHRVHGTVILPGTAFVELALDAGAEAGAPTLEELTIEAPLVLGEHGGAQLQLSLGGPDEQGRRRLEIHSRQEGAAAAGWARHASGLLGPAADERPEDLAEWPPPGAEPVAVADFYEHTADLGIDYGPAFRNLGAAWRRGEELFAEAELAPEHEAEAGRYGVHPALLDAAIHAGFLDHDAAAGPRVPFAWTGVRLFGAGATALRVRLAPAAGDAVSVTLADAAGAAVATIESLALRPVAAAQLRAGGDAAGADSLYVPRWQELELPDESGEGELARCLPGDGEDRAAVAQALCAEVLEQLQEAIAAAAQQPVAFVTRGAMAVAAGEAPDPAAAAVWGLVRSAQAEHPGRFLLIDSDGSEASEAALERALASEEEPQLALREGIALVPRLVPSSASATETEAPALDPERTLLVTGATGALGSLFARHLAAAHGARHLLLASRRGPEAPGAEELRTELENLGAEVTLAACDVGDREQLAALLAAIPAAHPLGMVVHCAAGFDNGLVAALSPARLATAMGPKAGAAWHLHELTAEIEDCDLVLVSSIAGSFENPGQANYAAANAFLDALAQDRAAAGLAASSIAFGPWQGDGDGRLGEADRARLGRAGFVAIAPERGLDLLDRAHRLAAPFAVAAPLDEGALRALARAGELPPLLRGIVRVAARRAGRGSLAERLAALPEAEREGAALELVRGHVAAILGHAAAAAIDPEAPFKELGFDSLAAVELRNRLGEATGLRLPATLVFDYPSAAAVAGFLVAEVDADGTGGDGTERKLDTIAAILGSLELGERAAVAARLQPLLASIFSGSGGDADAAEIDLEQASDAEIFELLDSELGRG